MKINSGYLENQIPTAWQKSSMYTFPYFSVDDDEISGIYFEPSDHVHIIRVISS